MLSVWTLEFVLKFYVFHVFLNFLVISATAKLGKSEAVLAPRQGSTAMAKGKRPCCLAQLGSVCSQRTCFTKCISTGKSTKVHRCPLQSEIASSSRQLKMLFMMVLMKASAKAGPKL